MNDIRYSELQFLRTLANSSFEYFSCNNEKQTKAVGLGQMMYVRACLGLLGEAYRGVGDEVAAIVVGQGHQRAIEISEAIRKGVESLRCEYKGIALPQVTASIGVATTPPEERKFEVETLAGSRKRQAKEKGKNRVVAN